MNKEDNNARSVVKPKRRRVLWIVIGAFMLGCAVTAIGSFVSAVAIEKTGNAEFCGSCHTMDPMIESYHNDVHGGSNPGGIVVECIDCHLPHDSLIHYMTIKARTGLNDVWVQNFGNPETIDWEERRSHREHFTYDSGCLKCHENYFEQTMGDHSAFIAHKEYALDPTAQQCVTCHENVGHKDLGLYINEEDGE